VRVLDAQLAQLRMAQAMGRDVDEQIRSTLIAMAKDAYVRGDTSIEGFGRTVGAILAGEPVAMLQPGEWIVPCRPADVLRS
jgi:hypothetical protein